MAASLTMGDLNYQEDLVGGGGGWTGCCHVQLRLDEQKKKG